MSHNPFKADGAKAVRYAQLASSIGYAVSADVAQLALADRGRLHQNLGSVLIARDVDDLVARYDLEGPRDLMLIALDAARRIARPPISEFVVGSIGLEAETGNLILGGNVEFPRTHLGLALHGEGFVLTRSFSRRTTISVLAIGEAHPCAHCRQYLSEFAATKNLDLIDPLGHTLTMADLYPWPFDPDYLGEVGVLPTRAPFPTLAYKSEVEPTAATELLLAAGRRAHAPYSKTPSAVVLRTSDGALIAGSTIESVAFNPSLGPLQAAIVDLLAHGYAYDEIAECWLGTVHDGAVDFRRSVSELLGSIAPSAAFHASDWGI